MASRSTQTLASFTRQLRPLSGCAQRSLPRLAIRRHVAPINRIAIPVRLAHNIPRPPPAAPAQPDISFQQNEDTFSSSATEDAASEGERPENKGPAYYQLSFTCIPCGHRSHHNISKQGYHNGSTLITCPSCRNRHVISDHLGIFGDRKITVEDLMREKGQLVKRGSLGEDGDIEFWPEETPESTAQDGGKIGGV